MNDFTVHTPEQLAAHDAATSKRYLEALREEQAENARLRRLLAISRGGVGLYTDDGELDDCSESPHIDYKRDPVEMIELKIQERATNHVLANTEKFLTFLDKELGAVK